MRRMNTFIYKKTADITVLAASFSDFKYKKHCHEEYALGVTLRGIQQYNLSGSLQSSYRDGVMLFNPQQVHDGGAQDKSGIDYVMLYIHPQLFLQLLGQKNIIKFPEPIVYDRTLEYGILNIIKAVFNQEDEALCSELLLDLAGCFVNTEINFSAKNENTLINKAKEMIYSNLDKTLRLDELCKEFSISKFQLIRLFKAGTGISPYQFYLNCKIEYARKIIENTKDVYAAVAECGFVDLTHLNRHFKSIYAVTPFEYLSNIS